MIGELSLEHGVSGICVLLALNVLVKVAQFYLEHQKKKEQLTEQTVKELIEAVKELNFRLVQIETSFTGWEKLKLDMVRSFTAIKALAGERWPSVREEIMKERDWST